MSRPPSSPMPMRVPSTVRRADLELVFDRRHVLHRLRLAFELVAPRLDAGAEDAAGGRHPAFRLAQLDQLAGDGDGEERDHGQEDQPDPEQIVLGVRNVRGDRARAPPLDGERRPGQRGDDDDDDDRRQRRPIAAAPAQRPRVGHEFDLPDARRRVVWHECPRRSDHCCGDVVDELVGESQERVQSRLKRGVPGGGADQGDRIARGEALTLSPRGRGWPRVAPCSLSSAIYQPSGKYLASRRAPNVLGTRALDDVLSLTLSSMPEG